MASSNVVAAVTAHIASLNAGSFKAKYGAAATPAQVGAACGYPGSKASALRQHLARQHGQGAQRTGHGRYPALTLTQWQQALNLGHLVRKPDATAQQRQQASKRVGAMLWQRKATRTGAKQAKGQAKQRAAQEPTAQAAEATAQASE